MKEGKIKSIGISNFDQKTTEELLEMAEIKPCVIQMEIHPCDQRQEFKAWLEERGMAAQTWYPLGHGDKSLIDESLFTELARKYGRNSV